MKASSAPIPFNRPLFLEPGVDHLRAAFRGDHISGDGPFTRRCQAALERVVGATKVLLTTSCTDALELSALLLRIAPGDEVIVPAFTFVSTANAFVLRGARPDTCNLDETLLEAAITPRTKAVVVVHYNGVGCEMRPILALAARHGLAVVEDNAHGLFGAYRGKPLGSFGQLAALSFHETKNLSCGEGGAVAINDRRLVGRAEILREKGTDRSRFFRGETRRYDWRDVGSSFLPSDILAALLWAQIQARRRIQARRQEIHLRYLAGLGEWAETHGIQLPAAPRHCAPSYHLFYLLPAKPGSQPRLIRHLAAQKIQAVFHYRSLNLSPMGRRFGGRPGQCPVAESVGRRMVRLPFYFDLKPADQDRVIDAVRHFADGRAAV